MTPAPWTADSARHSSTPAVVRIRGDDRKDSAVGPYADGHRRDRQDGDGRTPTELPRAINDVVQEALEPRQRRDRAGEFDRASPITERALGPAASFELRKALVTKLFHQKVEVQVHFLADGPIAESGERSAKTPPASPQPGHVRLP